MAALVIIVLVVIVIGLFNFFEGDELTDEQQIGRAAAAQNDALQRENYADFREYTCHAEQGTETEILDHQRDSAADKGARVLEGVSGVAIDGDRATAQTTYYFENDEDAKVEAEMTFVREDGAWKVCSTGPS